MFKKTVFCSFCRGLQRTLFASVVCFLSVFSTAFAYDFWVKIDGESATFSFSISAAGVFTVNCGNDANDVLSTSSNLEPPMGQDMNGDYTISRGYNTNSTTYTCNYSSTGNGAKYVKFSGNAYGYDNSSYVYDNNSPQQFPAIKFDDAYQITEIGGDLTAIFNHISSGSCNPSNGNTCYPSFSGTFEGAQITQIPSSLFASLASSSWLGYPHYMFYQTFKDCVELVSVPDGLFSHISRSGEYMFYETFFGCYGLTSIPSDLFAHFSEPKAHMFQETFYLNYDLSSTGVPNENYISPTLFHQNMQIQSVADFMTDIFYSASSLAYECPENYYQYMTGYESYWDGAVSCLPCPPGTYSAQGSTSMSDCKCHNYGATDPDKYFLGYPETGSTGTMINNAISEEGSNHNSLYATFSYGDVYVDGICSVTPGGMDIVGIPDTTQTGPYCWCRVTRFDLSGGQSSLFSEGDSYWVFHAHNGCEQAACESDCEESVYGVDNSLFRRSLYTNYHCPVYYPIDYSCNDKTLPGANNNNNSMGDVLLAGSTVPVPDPNLQCNEISGYSIIGWYCGVHGLDADFNDVYTYANMSVANTHQYANMNVETPSIFGVDEYHPSIQMSGNIVLNQGISCRAIWQKDPTCPAYILGVASGDSNAENINHNGTYGSSGVSADVVQFVNQASQMDYQIRFETIASSTYGLMNIAGNPSSNSSGDNCWCRVTQYDKDGTGNFQTLNNMPWVFAGIRNGNNNNCSTFCGNAFATSSQFRTTAYTTNICSFTISYNCNGGNGGPLLPTTTDGLNYTLGHTASECGTLSNPNCYLDTTGYVTGGTSVSGDAWSCLPAGGNQSDYLTSSSGTLPVASNYTCVAQWYCCPAGQILNSAGNGCVARKVQLEWDSNGGTSVNNTSYCSYGSTTNPGNINNINQPSKPGYSFKAWLVKRWRSCSFFGANPSLSSSQYCAENADSTCYENDSMINCSDSLFDDLTPGQWKARFNYGTIYGLAQCSVTGGGLGETKNTIDSSVGGNCWCAASSYSPNPTGNTGDACTFDSPVWILLAPDGTVESCNQGCAKICAGTLGVGNLDFRKLFFDAY